MYLGAKLYLCPAFPPDCGTDMRLVNAYGTVFYRMGMGRVHPTLLTVKRLNHSKIVQILFVQGYLFFFCATERKRFRATLR
jgi:hypothetical protein